MAVELAQELKKDNINISLMVTIDLQAVSNTTDVPSNVWIAKNYYQTNSSSIVNWEPLWLSKDNSQTNLTNTITNHLFDISGEMKGIDNFELWHQSIDNTISFRVSKDIYSVLH